MVGTAGQRERDEYSAVPLWSKYIALSTKVGEGVPIPLPFFAFVTECLIWGLGCCSKNADLKTEQFFPVSLPSLLTEGVLGIFSPS